MPSPDFEQEASDARAASTRITGARQRDLPPMSFSFSSPRPSAGAKTIGSCYGSDAAPTPPSRRRALNKSQSCGIDMSSMEDCSLKSPLALPVSERRWSDSSCSFELYFEEDDASYHERSRNGSFSCPSTPVRKTAYYEDCCQSSVGGESFGKSSSSIPPTRKNRTVQFLSSTKSRRLQSLSRHTSIHEA